MVKEKEVEEKVKEENTGAPVEKEAVISKEVETAKDASPKVKIDLTGEGFKDDGDDFVRPKIPEDSYKSNISDVVFLPVQKWGAKPGVKEEKFIFSYLIEQPIGEPVIITSFVNPSITKSNNAKYSNSKLFEIISSANLLEEVGNLLDELSVQKNLVAWVQKSFIGRDCRVSVENNKAGTCSTIRKILSFEPVAKEEK